MDQLLRKWVDFPKLIPARETQPNQHNLGHKQHDLTRWNKAQATCQAAILEYQRQRHAERRKEKKKQRMEQEPLCLVEKGVQAAESSETLPPSLKRRLAIEEEIKDFKLRLEHEGLPASVYDNVVDITSFLELLETSLESPLEELLIVSKTRHIARPLGDFIYLIEGKIERPIDDVVFSCTEALFKQRDVIARQYSNLYTNRLTELMETKFDVEEENQRLKAYIEELENTRESEHLGSVQKPCAMFETPIARNTVFHGNYTNIRQHILERSEVRDEFVSSPIRSHGSTHDRSPQDDQRPSSAGVATNEQRRRNPVQLEDNSSTTYGRVVRVDEIGPIFDYSSLGISV